MSDIIEYDISRLNDEERAILKLLCNAMNTSEISKYLGFSYKYTAVTVSKLKNQFDMSTISELEKHLSE